jgi:hypothetical protein
MREQALLLTGDHSIADDRRAERLLEFFGVSYHKQNETEFRALDSRSAGSKAGCRILCAAQTFASVIKEQKKTFGSNGFAQQIHSVFLYSSGDPVALAKIVSQLSGASISVCRGAKNHIRWHIANEPDGVCGAMRALHVQPAATTLSSCDFFELNENSASALIASEDKAAFVKLICAETPVFVSSVSLLDIDAELMTRNFDIRDHLFSAVPIVSYIKWAFPHSSWSPPEASACLIIDDPLLKARYGFVRFRKLLTLMKQLRFSTSIAFIPWNWQRSNPSVVQLFKGNRDYYSLCIHGCDHTAREFSASDRRRLRAAASEAVRRMSLHEERTGLAHDRIMVFPQGIFSKEAIAELKHAGFHAVVNTEVHSIPPGPHKPRISDVWDIAVMTYGDFPIYTRRYPAQGVENFAFDLLLGKPCLVVIHHDFCSDGYERLSHFVDQLNALKVPLVWRCLGDVLRRSYRQKEVSPDSIEIEMYGSELLIENRSERMKSYLIRRRERHPDSIENLDAGSRQLPWECVGDWIQFKLELPPGETTLLTLHFKGAEDVAYVRQNFAHRVKTMLRRHLSEARDNYLVPAKARMVAFSRS